MLYFPVSLKMVNRTPLVKPIIVLPLDKGGEGGFDNSVREYFKNGLLNLSTNYLTCIIPAFLWQVSGLQLVVACRFPTKGFGNGVVDVPNKTKEQNLGFRFETRHIRVRYTVSGAKTYYGQYVFENLLKYRTDLAPVYPNEDITPYPKRKN